MWEKKNRHFNTISPKKLLFRKRCSRCRFEWPNTEITSNAFCPLESFFNSWRTFYPLCVFGYLQTMKGRFCFSIRSSRLSRTFNFHFQYNSVNIRTVSDCTKGHANQLIVLFSEKSHQRYSRMISRPVSLFWQTVN